jgi:hypothetical protein
MSLRIATVTRHIHNSEQNSGKPAHIVVNIVFSFMSLVAFVLYDAYVHKVDLLLLIHLFNLCGYLVIVTTGTGDCASIVR